MFYILELQYDYLYVKRALSSNVKKKLLCPISDCLLSNENNIKCKSIHQALHTNKITEGKTLCFCCYRNFRTSLMFNHEITTCEIKHRLSLARLWSSAHSFDLEVSEQRTLEFSDWESRDYCIYHWNTELSSRTTYLSRRAQRYSYSSCPLLQCMILHCIA